jgi:hypothetical protein
MKDTEELFIDWVENFSANLPESRSVLRIQRATPRFQTRNYFARYKVVTAILDGTGQNPSQSACVIVEVSATDQTAQTVDTACESVPDL